MCVCVCVKVLVGCVCTKGACPVLVFAGNLFTNFRDFFFVVLFVTSSLTRSSTSFVLSLQKRAFLLRVEATVRRCVDDRDHPVVDFSCLDVDVRVRVRVCVRV